MSLNPIYICCDDGQVYKCDFITGDGWWIELNEYQDDTLWIAAAPRPKFALRNQARPIHAPVNIIGDNGLPIASLKFLRNGDWKGRDVAIYAIRWEPGKAFPRKHLEGWRKPSNCRIPGTMVCYTASHRRLATSVD